MPELIASGATALEVIRDALTATGHGTFGTDLFLGLEVDGDLDRAGDTIIPDAAVIITEGDGIPELTMGTAVALERPSIQVMVRGPQGDYLATRKRAMAIRYEIASLRDFTSQGLRLLSATPIGSVLPLGPDVNGRPRFTVNFNTTTDPSYTP